MTKASCRVVNLFMLAGLLFTAWLAFSPGRLSVDKQLSCRNELIGHQTGGEEAESHYMQVDYVLKGDRVTINYRYFSNVGKAISVITMKGKIIDSLQNGHQFHLGLSQVDIATLDSEASQPQHMKYMANVSRMNLDNHDIHSETINILAERNGYAHILFEPSNVVCGCKVIS